MPPSGKNFIGVAGWRIPARYAAEFPPGGSHIERYAHRLSAVEINSSFYKSHRAETYERWAGSTPSEFRFSVKAPKTITHEHRLVDCEALIQSFAAEVLGLGLKLSVILIQLPPTLAFDQDVLEKFLSSFRSRFLVPVVIEPRHSSWFTPEVDYWLGTNRIARVAADPPIATGGNEPGGSSDLRYYRLHGSPRLYFSDYDEVTLLLLRQQLGQREAPLGSWCIFDNTGSGAALGNALKLRSLLSQAGGGEPLERRSLESVIPRSGELHE